ncbi:MULTISPECIES: transcription antitermination factor NusB [unclassified Bartonella]|uniref:transcription antitermination factor NusB n=1 Tax=unclassified Bartonella TaxID=2645622 RepID=UPI0015FB0C74|nr:MULTISPECIES: transcription antitermination factor NusB [unclassified Bartonella]UXN04501.1 transcription antitermination factor NusB [Bartonella sp. HY406]UXN07494.1 transcription antitermination factor NusB [Bartonella sp. HY761]
MSEENKKPSVRPANKRGAARLAAVQALYQMDIAGSGVMETVTEYESFRLGKDIDGDQYLEADAQWFRSIIAGVVAEQREIDPLIHDFLPEGWPLSRIDTTLRAILRAGIWELKNRPEVPLPVIVSEYVDIAKAFFGKEEPKLVNALLDNSAKQLRKS